MSRGNENHAELANDRARNNSNGSNDIAVLRHCLSSKRPAEMDRASWELIKRLHHVDVDIDIESLALAQELQKEELLLFDRSKRQLEEQLSLTVAKRIQEEDFHRRLAEKLLEEKQSLEVAKLIQAEENLQEASSRHRTLTKTEVLQSLEPCQRAALNFVQVKALRMHSIALPALKRRIKGLGFEVDSLYRCLEYVQEDAPIIIHLKQETLNLLVKDTHYRNLFETKTSGGNKDPQVRHKWEESLFGRCYNGCEPSLRPKYGCLNITGDIRGVGPARYYGAMFLTLAPHVRHRATFSDKDTGSAKAGMLATNELYAHILAQYPDTDLRAALSVSRIGGAPSKCGMYKEVQIHGPVCLATDVQALSVPGRAKEASIQLQHDVEKFQELTGCNVLWQGDLLGS